MKRTPIVIVEDSREQRPLDFAPYADAGIAVERRRLRTGDYSVAGYEHHICIERKSLEDCVGSLTHGRKRFTREMYDRGAFVPVKHLVVEASWQQLSAPYDFAPGAAPLSIVNSLYSLMMPPTNVHVFTSPSRALIAWYIVKVAENFVRRVTHGPSGMWASLFDEGSADLAPIPCPYREVK